MSLTYLRPGKQPTNVVSGPGLVWTAAAIPVFPEPAQLQAELDDTMTPAAVHTRQCL